MNEAGVPGYEAVLWLGLMAPKGTPTAIVQRLNAELARITPMTMGVDEFTQHLNQDIAKWARVVKFSGAKAEWRE
jgi:tripartite-type tricarboxylate transporter receptor subunit TctC